MAQSMMLPQASRCLPASTSGRTDVSYVRSVACRSAMCRNTIWPSQQTDSSSPAALCCHRYCHGAGSSRHSRSGLCPDLTGLRSAVSPVAAAAASMAEGASEVQPILVGVNCDRIAAAAALAGQLQDKGCTEVWATGAANHYLAIGVLATAQEMLQRRQPAAGLAARFRLAVPDFTPSEQARRLRKLVLTVELLVDPVDLSPWADPVSRTSSNRTKDFGELGAAVLKGVEGEGAVFEARGEQAVTRLLKTLLGAQRQLEGALELLPAWGDVVDVAAEKKGEQKLALGLLLLVRGVRV